MKTNRLSFGNLVTIALGAFPALWIMLALLLGSGHAAASPTVPVAAPSSTFSVIWDQTVRDGSGAYPDLLLDRNTTTPYTAAGDTYCGTKVGGELVIPLVVAWPCGDVSANLHFDQKTSGPGVGPYPRLELSHPGWSFPAPGVGVIATYNSGDNSLHIPLSGSLADN